MSKAGDEAVFSEVPDVNLVDLEHPEPRVPDRGFDVDQDDHEVAVVQDGPGLEAVEV